MLARRYFFSAVFGDPAYLDSATALARKSLALRPDLDEAYGTLGDIQSQQGRLAQAEGSYAKALRLAARAAPLSGNDPVLYYHVAAALLRLERDDVTKAWLLAGTRRSNPSLSRLEVQLSELDFLRGQHAQAKDRAERLLAREPGDE